MLRKISQQQDESLMRTQKPNSGWLNILHFCPLVLLPQLSVWIAKGEKKKLYHLWILMGGLFSLNGFYDSLKKRIFLQGIITQAT